mmetsp:Transcript_49282/g.111810  ORF Transcript_49282/g.111810 Transcript_49282/m.111810 type:complete len:228 (+) Transcript_49282:33-716(+)
MFQTSSDHADGPLPREQFVPDLRICRRTHDRVRDRHVHHLDRGHGLRAGLQGGGGDVERHPLRPAPALLLPRLRLVHGAVAVAHVQEVGLVDARPHDAHGEHLLARLLGHHARAHQGTHVLPGVFGGPPGHAHARGALQRREHHRPDFYLPDHPQLRRRGVRHRDEHSHHPEHPPLVPHLLAPRLVAGPLRPLHRLCVGRVPDQDADQKRKASQVEGAATQRKGVVP